MIINKKELKKNEKLKNNKELILFYVLLAIIGSTSGASIGFKLGSVTLSFQILEALFCGSLVGPMVFVAGNLVLAGRPKKVHEEMLSKFGNGYCGVILFFLIFWATSIGIRIGLGAIANAISPDAIVSGALMLGIIGGIVPVISFVITNFAIMPVIKKIKECFSSKEENSNSGPCATNNSDGVSLSSGSNNTSQTEISSVESLESLAAVRV